MRRLPALFLAMIIASPLYAMDVQGRLEQGGIALGQARPGAAITLDGRAVAQDDQGRFLLGFGREAPAKAVLSVDGHSQTLSIAPRQWQIQRINGLPPAKVTPDPDALARIAQENKLVAERRASSAPRALFLADGFAAPADGIISGVFGSQRILNGEARAPHSGTDIAAPAGAVARAAADGIVSMVHADMYFTGQTVMIDHGLGLQTVYAHLSRIDVHEGETVTRGQQIGAVGASGRATGPHLHWGTSWQDVRLDPETVLAVLGRK